MAKKILRRQGFHERGGWAVERADRPKWQPHSEGFQSEYQSAGLDLIADPEGEQICHSRKLPRFEPFSGLLQGVQVN
jgi:hypothetical protein